MLALLGQVLLLAAAGKPSDFRTCAECIEAGFGWSLKKGRCGGFPNHNCPEEPPSHPPTPAPGPPQLDIVSPVGFEPRTDALKTTVRTVEFPASPPVFVDVNEPAPEWDDTGYILTHHCQGRFGNQMDYLLGTMDTAKKANRTLVLPPFTDYSTSK